MLRKAICVLGADKKWLNPPPGDFLWEEKILQLQLAAELGFTIPETLVSHDRDEVRTFYAQCPHGMITKVLKAVVILDTVIFTHLVTLQEMEQIDSVRFAPAIFQRCIPKDYELRITVVGEEIFAAKVLSQEDEETRIDWRRKPARDGTHPVKFEATTLPTEVAKQLLNFIQATGLRYGAIDMIVSPDGEYIFLEVNPAGQWYFVQKATDLNIAGAIARELLGM